MIFRLSVSVYDYEYKEICKRGLFTIISLTLGNSRFPFRNSLPGNTDSLCYLFLGKFIKLSQCSQIIGDITFLHFHTFRTSQFHYTLILWKFYQLSRTRNVIFGCVSIYLHLRIMERWNTVYRIPIFLYHTRASTQGMQFTRMQQATVLLIKSTVALLYCLKPDHRTHSSRLICSLFSAPLYEDGISNTTALLRI